MEFFESDIDDVDALIRKVSSLFTDQFQVREKNSFFQAIGDCINRFNLCEQHNEKMLRQLCKSYVEVHADRDLWLQELISDLDSYCRYIQYPRNELSSLSEPFYIMGRIDLEGRILCKVLKKRIHLVKLIDDDTSLDGISTKEFMLSEHGICSVQIQEIDLNDQDIMHVLQIESSYYPIIKQYAHSRTYTEEELAKSPVFSQIISNTDSEYPGQALHDIDRGGVLINNKFIKCRDKSVVGADDQTIFVDTLVQTEEVVRAQVSDKLIADYIINKGGQRLVSFVCEEIIRTLINGEQIEKYAIGKSNGDVRYTTHEQVVIAEIRTDLFYLGVIDELRAVEEFLGQSERGDTIKLDIEGAAAINTALVKLDSGIKTPVTVPILASAKLEIKFKKQSDLCEVDGRLGIELISYEVSYENVDIKFDLDKEKLLDYAVINKKDADNDKEVSENLVASNRRRRPFKTLSARFRQNHFPTINSLKLSGSLRNRFRNGQEIITPAFGKSPSEGQSFPYLFPSRKSRPSLQTLFLNRSKSDTAIDERWYSGDDMNTLLKDWMSQFPEIECLSTMLGTSFRQVNQWGNVLNENMLQFHCTRQALLNQGSQLKEKVIVPINLSQKYWSLLYIVYQENKMKKIECFNPFGRAPTRDVIAILNNLYPDVKIEQIGKSVQHDTYNCGPWVIEAAKLIAKVGNINQLEMVDIEEARRGHQAIIENTRAALKTSSYTG